LAAFAPPYLKIASHLSVAALIVDDRYPCEFVTRSSSQADREAPKATVMGQSSFKTRCGADTECEG